MDDVLLIIEAADTSIEYDRSVRLPLYARGGIPDVWLVNLEAGRVEVYSQPVHGTYQNVQFAKRGESLSLKGLPNLSLRIEEILG